MLLDCGPGTIGALFRTKLAFPKTQTLVVSHLHMDHIHGFGAWLSHLTFPYAILPTVYGPPGTRKYVDFVAQATAMVGSVFGRPFGDPMDVPVMELADGSDVQLAHARVQSIVVPHAPELVAMSHRVEFGGRTTVFSGDTRAEPELMTPLADGADVLIHEAYTEAGLTEWTRGAPQSRIDAIFAAYERTHSKVAVAARIAAEAGAKKLVLTHLCPGERPEVLTAEAAAHFSGEIVVADDGLSLDV
jgi:ribonuclease BN (tRNA processing enzyme)